MYLYLLTFYFYLQNKCFRNEVNLSLLLICVMSGKYLILLHVKFFLLHWDMCDCVFLQILPLSKGTTNLIFVTPYYLSLTGRNMYHKILKKIE